ncbi:MAG TPA: hypothetical protein DDZ80_04090 [Cyanobacteria bacterium UBA8803]|nr:hypothetical protein [Cyanobacteria bacterium UBA9273]HBL57741.1 hypothetical protein [Cyanobacteria bacterium UBA8803]
MRLTWLTSLIFTSAIVLLASFLPWASLQPLEPNNIALPITPRPFLGVAFGVFTNQTLTVTAWQGKFLLGIYAIPNWVVVLSALCIPFLVNKPTIGIIIAIFSLIHLVIFTVVIYLAGARFGIGYITTIVTYIIIIILLVKRLGYR